MNNGNGGLYFIVGGLCVLVLGFLYFGGVIHPGHMGRHEENRVESGSTTTVEHTTRIPGVGETTTSRTVEKP